MDVEPGGRSTSVGRLPAVDDELLLYKDLRRLAARRLRSLSPGDTLSATALVHEAYLKLSASKWASQSQVWTNKSVFFAVASEAMRQIIIDHHRKKASQKRGGQHARLHIEIDSLPGQSAPVDVLALSEALDVFAASHPTKAVLVKLRYFAGLSMPECAEALDVSLPTAERHWRYARAWLADYLGVGA
ncbi:MAG: ECF-type sigma factor [Aureliella sp.]